MITKNYLQPFDAEQLQPNACAHAHLVVIAPNVLCRECLCAFPLPAEVDLQSTRPDADTEDCESPAPLNH